MQVSNATTIPFVPVSFGTSEVQSSSTPAATASRDADQLALNMTSATFDSLVQEAKSYPEVRSEVVHAYKSQVALGHYPPVDVLSGLAELLSGSSS